MIDRPSAQRRIISSVRRRSEPFAGEAGVIASLQMERLMKTSSWGRGKRQKKAEAGKSRWH